jgi:hypothetical protein
MKARGQVYPQQPRLSLLTAALPNKIDPITVQSPFTVASNETESVSSANVYDNLEKKPLSVCHESRREVKKTSS